MTYPAPFPPQPMPAPAPSRSKLMIVLIIIAALLAGGLGYGAVIYLGRQNNSPQGTGASSSPTTTPTPTSTIFTGDLRTLLVSSPSGSNPFKHPLSIDGNLSLDEISVLYSDPDRIKTILTENEFESGAVIQWVQSDGVEVEIKLYSFAKPAGALAWASSEASSYTFDDKLLNRSPIDGIFGSTLVIDPQADSDGYIQTIAIASKHNVAMKVFVFQKSSPAEAATVDLAKAQYAKLP